MKTYEALCLSASHCKDKTLKELTPDVLLSRKTLKMLYQPKPRPSLLPAFSFQLCSDTSRRIHELSPDAFMLGSPIDDNRSYSEQAAQKQQLKLHCTEGPSVAKTETERAAKLAERNQINPCYVATRGHRDE